MMLYILTIYMVNGYTTYGYKFLEKKNCEKVGKELIKPSKQWYYACRRKHYELNR